MSTKPFSHGIVRSSTLDYENDPIFRDLPSIMDETYKENISKLSSDVDKKVLVIYGGGQSEATPDGEEIRKSSLQAFKKLVKGISHLYDKDYAFFNGGEDFLITPKTIYGKRIWYKIEQFGDLTSSHENGDDTSEYIKIAEIIQANYNKYDSFIILHNTDIMAYMASALSFILEDLAKTVILTGFQVPLTEMTNDALENLLGALTIAGHFTIPEVTIYFSNKLFRGNRATKVDSFGLECFDSPNNKPLVVFGTGPKIDWDLILKYKDSKLHVHKKIRQKVGVIKFYPSIPIKLIKTILSTDMEAFVLEAFGAGGLPFKNTQINELLKEASSKGKIMVVITQCAKGSAPMAKTLSQQYDELGLVSGLDMTTECAIAKLSYLLGKGLSREEVMKMIQKDLRGEVTEYQSVSFAGNEASILEMIKKASQNGAEQQVVKERIFPALTSYAAHLGFINILKEMRPYVNNFETGDYEGRTPLHIAAKCGQNNVIDFMISLETDVNMKDKQGRSPLFEAVLNGNMETARKLLEVNAKACAGKEDMRKLLFKLVGKGDLEGLKMLYEGGVRNLEEYGNMDKRNIAHIACADGREDVVRFLVEQADFNLAVKDRWGQTPIDEANRIGNQNIINIIEKKIISEQAVETDVQEQLGMFGKDDEGEEKLWLNERVNPAAKRD